MIRLIDANALIDAMYAANVASAYEAQDIINSAPTIDAVSVVHGEWIAKYEGSYLQRRMYCSVCGKKSGIGGIESNQRKPYCPNCGAKMKGADDETDNI